MEKPGMTDQSPPVGQPVDLAPGIRRIIAPNPSPMTYWGTNTYLLGQDTLMIIDPGPESTAHLLAVMAAISGATVSHIIVTHSHLDHSPLAAVLADKVKAPVCAFGDSYVGKTGVMTRLEWAGLSGGGEGIDHTFVPNNLLADSETVENSDLTLQVVHTPGHMGNHISLQWDDVIFTGDLVMGWASTMVSPPDGDLADFLNSCEKLKTYKAKRFYPGHGDPIDDPHARLDWLIAHRHERTEQIKQVLKSGPLDIHTITRQIYNDAPNGLLRAAARNVFAHLIQLETMDEVSAIPNLHPEAKFALKNTLDSAQNQH